MKQDEQSEAVRDIRVLVVDDHFPTRDMVKAILRNLGFRHIDQADGGKPAINKAKEVRYGLIVCDWNMPDLQGIEVLRFVRGKIDADVPFLMLTAEAYRENVKKAVELGVSDYVTKPFTAQVLGEKVLALVG